MAKSYKAGIVGCGSVAHAHVEGYQQLDQVEIVAVVDPHAPARQIYLDTYGIAKGFDTIEGMLEAEVPDIVSVCTWHLLHPEATIAAAQAGVAGVICEKPMAIGAGEADRMVEACEARAARNWSSATSVDSHPVGERLGILLLRVLSAGRSFRRTGSPKG
jgi:UDP-N-acetyl-2-amino-2-deoxyglucuronate dehydrogenase